MANDARPKRSASPDQADRLSGTLDRLVFYFRKWYVQQWNADVPAGGSLIGRYMLERLATSTEPWRMSDLARVLDTSGRMVTSLVDAYEAEGIVRRRVHPTDRRAFLVELVIAPAAARLPLREYHLGAATLFNGVSAADREVFLRVAEHLITQSRQALLPSEDTEVPTERRGRKVGTQPE